MALKDHKEFKVYSLFFKHSSKKLELEIGLISLNYLFSILMKKILMSIMSKTIGKTFLVKLNLKLKEFFIRKQDN